MATVPAPGLLNVMADESTARAAAAEDPEAFGLIWWGKRVAGVQVALSQVDRAALDELLDGAQHRSTDRRPWRPASQPSAPSGRPAPSTSIRNAT